MYAAGGVLQPVRATWDPTSMVVQVDLHARERHMVLRRTPLRLCVDASLLSLETLSL